MQVASANELLERMGMTLPSDIAGALRVWLDTQTKGSQRAVSAALSTAYRAGQSSAATDIGAYVTTRVPATFAANIRAMTLVREVMPDFAPASLLDLGAGPGTATWAALQSWSSLKDIALCERDPRFAELASMVNAQSDQPPLQMSRILRMHEAQLPLTEKADLVVSSYMLAELPLEAMADVALRMWSRTNTMLLLIEPGTPRGFARLRVVRDQFLKQRAHIVAPCTHQLACPMANDDWCHFKVRLQRSRDHMHAKQATVPFEDEPFSYLALSRESPAHTGARVLTPPLISKVQAQLRVCENGKVEERLIAARDKPEYKRAKKVQWGDIWTS
jgi:ribosomal protein RSM22 (predicted rRNA methylase)